MPGVDTAGQPPSDDRGTAALRRLRSPLHAALHHAVVTVGEALDADIAAGRFFENADTGFTGCVHCLATTTTPVRQAIRDWPFRSHSLFEVGRNKAPAPADMTAPHSPHSDADHPHPGSPWRHQLFDPIDQYFIIHDVLCLRLPLSDDAVAVLAFVRCDPSGRFTADDHACRQQLRDPVADLLRRALVHATTASLSLALSRLSPKELQVARLLAEGRTEPQVAARLARSPHTIHTHVKSIYRKLNITTRQQLMELL